MRAMPSAVSSTYVRRRSAGSGWGGRLFGMGLWYKALSLGSVLRVSQVQLLQPFMTILFAGLLFGEHIDAVTWTAAAVVVFSIQLSRMARVSLNH